MSALGHAVRLARIDLTRTLRKHLDVRTASSVVSVVVYALVALLLTLGGGYLAFRAGEATVAGNLDLGPTVAIEIVRGLFALFGLVVTVVVLVRAVGQRGVLTNAEGILTVVPTGDALVGVLLAETAYLLLWVLVPALGVGIGLALGTGVAWPVLTVPLSFASAAVVAVGVGYPLGVGIRHVVTRFPFVARHKVSLILVVFVGYIVFVTSGALNETAIALLEPLGAAPPGWFADLMVLGTPAIAASPLNAAGAVGLTAVVALAAALAGTKIAGIHWFSDPALAGEKPKSVREGPTRPGVETTLAPFVGRPTAALVVLAWRRARRAPLKLLYAAYPLLLIAGVLADAFQRGEVPAYLPFGTVAFVAWASGVVFTLNPLGDQGSVLPTTLLSRVDGQEFVHAHLLASLVVAVPVGTAVTAVVALVSPVETTTAIALTVATPVVVTVSAVLSVGIGTAFPRFRAINVTRSMKTVLPSKWAFLLFSLHLVATVLAGVAVYEPIVREVGAALLTWLLPFGLEVSAGEVYAASAVALVPLLLAPVASYRYAVRAYDGYHLP